MTHHTRRVLTGAVLLTIAGFISKILGAMYRIPLQNLTGNVGFYAYQQIYPLLATIVILSLYGFPSAVSKLAVETRKNYGYLSYRNFFVPIFLTLFFVSSLFALVIFCLAPFMGEWTYNRPMERAWMLSALLFLFIPFLALFRGVFQADLDMRQTAYSQVVEQVIRVTMIVVASLFIYFNKMNVDQIATVSVLASALGMGGSVVLLFVYFIKSYPIKQSKKRQVEANPMKGSYYIKTIVSFGIFVSLNHLTFVILQWIDVFTLVPQLMKQNISFIEATTKKGIFDRGIPLIQFGVVLGSSFALAFIPLLSGVVNNEANRKEQTQAIHDALSLTLYMATAATVGLIVLFPEVNELLYLDRAHTGTLQIYATAILFLSLTITGVAILQGANYMRLTIYLFFGTFIMKIVLNYGLVPLFGISGGALATSVSLLLLVVVIIIQLRKKLAFNFLRKIRWLPFIGAIAIMVLYLFMIKYIVGSKEWSRDVLFFYTGFLVISGAFLYTTLLLRYNLLNKRHIVALPFSSLIFSLQRFVRKHT